MQKLFFSVFLPLLPTFVAAIGPAYQLVTFFFAFQKKSLSQSKNFKIRGKGSPDLAVICVMTPSSQSVTNNCGAKSNLLFLPAELQVLLLLPFGPNIGPQLMISALDAEIFAKYHLLSKQAAISTHFTRYGVESCFWTSFRSELNKTGLWLAWHDAGKEKKRQRFENGKKEGVFRSFYENGHVKQQCLYEDDKRAGEFKSWHKNGNLREHFFYEDGKKEGMCKVWAVNGNLGQEWVYKKGVKEGEQKSYYTKTSGKLLLHYHCYYKNGKAEGEATKFYDTGKLWTESFYKDGKRDGEY